MQAIILAGGLGTRLQPLTSELPKPMIPVINKPLMEYSIELLKKHGISDIGITVMFLPDQIKEYFGNGEKWGVNITYFEEDKPLGTAGSVKLAADFLTDRFIVISGDALTNIDIEKINLYHESIGADVTMVLSKQNQPLEYGVVLTDDSGKICAFAEKPQWEEITANTVNTGIYVIERSILDKIPENESFDFSKDLFPMLLAENYKMYGYITEDYWNDLGNPKSYMDSCFALIKDKAVQTEENVIISQTAQIVPPVYISKNTIISGDCSIGPNAIIGENCKIEDSSLSECIIWNSAVIKGCDIKKSVIGENTTAENDVFGGSNIIGSNVTIGKNVHISCGVNIYNNIALPRNSSINEDVTEGVFVQKNLFNNGSICGIWNNDVSYRTIAAIACSYSAQSILIASSNDRLGISLANMAASYYSLTGANAYLTSCCENAARYFSCVHNIKAVYINAKNENVQIELINENGLNIPASDEKKINIKKVSFSLARGKIIKISKVNENYQFFLNRAVPFSYKNVELYSADALPLHNVICKLPNDKTKTNISSAQVIAADGTVTDVFDSSLKRMPLENFLKLKIELCDFLGAKEVFLPIYAHEEVREIAQSKGMKILDQLQHKGNRMQQCSSFNNVALLLEYEPSFFAEALSCYLEENTLDMRKTSSIARVDFECNESDKCNTVFALNREKNRVISADYRGGNVTIVPGNNSYSFSAYGRFASEEYASDMTSEFVSKRLQDQNNIRP